jgi:hypothetical protein
MRRYLGTTKNGCRVYIPATSHASTHLADAPGLEQLVCELLPQLHVEGKNLFTDHDMGRVVGLTDLVATTEKDEIVYAKRPYRNDYARFVLHREPQPTTYITVALNKRKPAEYDLVSAWIGSIAPPFPGDIRATTDSEPFWKTHALVWGQQKIQEDSVVTIWPWR